MRILNGFEKKQAKQDSCLDQFEGLPPPPPPPRHPNECGSNGGKQMTQRVETREGLNKFVRKVEPEKSSYYAKNGESGSLVHYPP